VLAAVKKWVASLDKSDPDYDLHLAQALFVQQGHHAVDPALLKQTLRAKDYHARSAATHVLGDEWDRIPNAMALVKPQIADEHPRVRLEAVRALSFAGTLEAVELALEAARQPLDYYVEYTRQRTLGALEPLWKSALAKGAIAKNNPAGLEFITSYSQGHTPVGAAKKHLETLLTKTDLKPAQRKKEINGLADARGKAEAGKQVFARICIACHKVGNEGAELGPDMNKLATRLKREEIIESIIDPNAKIDPKYLATNVTTKDGDEISGLVVTEDDQTLTVAMGSGQKQIIRKSNIQSRATLKVSSMPEGLAQTMSAQEFVDLIEFLASQK